VSFNSKLFSLPRTGHQSGGVSRKAFRVGRINNLRGMKKLITLLIVLLAVSFAAEMYAQSISARAGLNLATMLSKDDDDTYSDDAKMKPGFHVGVSVDVPFDDNFAFQTGLLLSNKGVKYSGDDNDYEWKEKLSLYYLEIPLMAKATFDMGGAKIYGVFGPYLGLGIAGKYKWEETYDGDTDEDDESVDWGSDEDKDDFKRLDFGLNIGAGVEIDDFQIGIQYGLGLANVSPYSDDGYRENHRVLAITLGYKLFTK